MRIVIAGGSGFLGRHLARRLRDRGHDAVVLTRSPDPSLELPQLAWDGKTVGGWADALRTEEPLAVVNLAGKLVECRPTSANIAALTASRVDATRALVQASRQLDRPVDHWLQASTTAIWSDAGERRLTETSPLPVPGLPQMTGVAAAWERAFIGANTRRHLILRTSIVLAEGCPAWHRLSQITRFGLGGAVGGGRQWFSWIHLEDWLAIAEAALGLVDGVAMPDGVLVASSPHPVRNAELMSSLRHHVRRPGLPAPAALVRLGGLVLDADPALALTGRHATSALLASAGFRFRYPQLADAIGQIGRG